MQNLSGWFGFRPVLHGRNRRWNKSPETEFCNCYTSCCSEMFHVSFFILLSFCFCCEFFYFPLSFCFWCKFLYLLWFFALQRFFFLSWVFSKIASFCFCFWVFLFCWVFFIVSLCLYCEFFLLLWFCFS